MEKEDKQITSVAQDYFETKKKSEVIIISQKRQMLKQQDALKTSTG